MEHEDLAAVETDSGEHHIQRSRTSRFKGSGKNKRARGWFWYCFPCPEAGGGQSNAPAACSGLAKFFANIQSIKKGERETFSSSIRWTPTGEAAAARCMGEECIGAARAMETPAKPPAPEPPPRNLEVQGHARNAPCPCGSGDKYKRCHGADVLPATAKPWPAGVTPVPPTVPTTPPAEERRAERKRHRSWFRPRNEARAAELEAAREAAREAREAREAAIDPILDEIHRKDEARRQAARDRAAAAPMPRGKGGRFVKRSA